MYSSGVAPLLYFGGGRERGGREKKEVLGHDGTSSWIHWTVERRGGAKGGGGMAKGKTEAMTPLPELLALVPPLPSSKRPRWRRRHIPLTETALPCRRLLTMAPQLMGN